MPHYRSHENTGDRGEDAIRRPLLRRAERNPERQHRRGVDAVHVVAEQRALQFVEEQHQPVGEQHLREMIALVQARDRQPLDHQTEQRHHRDADQDRREQAAGARRNPVREIRAQHVERPVREIQHAEDAEDQRQSARDEKQQQALLDSVQDLQGKKGKAHFTIAQPNAGSSASFCAMPMTVSFPPFTWRR